jgi:hypothetical protein
MSDRSKKIARSSAPRKGKSVVAPKKTTAPATEADLDAAAGDLANQFVKAHSSRAAVQVAAIINGWLIARHLRQHGYYMSTPDSDLSFETIATRLRRLFQQTEAAIAAAREVLDHPLADDAGDRLLRALEILEGKAGIEQLEATLAGYLAGGDAQVLAHALITRGDLTADELASMEAGVARWAAASGGA